MKLKETSDRTIPGKGTEEAGATGATGITNTPEQENGPGHRNGRGAPDEKNGFKEKVCRVIPCHNNQPYVDINFDNYGIRLISPNPVNGDTVTVKYKGEIGQPDFEVRL